MNGLILLDKPEGVTSFAALGRVKRVLGTRKVGHTGTLDPFATGLLVVLSGTFTRLADHITALDKRYEARFRFGLTTDTLDRDGSVTGEGPVPDRAEVERAMSGLVGAIDQIPPAYSAIRVNGERAHRLAREGRAPVLAPRSVTIHSCRLREWEPPDAVVEVHCSKGAYIRSLVRDVAAAAGTVGLVQELRRTSVGAFSVEDAVSTEAFDAERHIVGGKAVLAAIEGARSATVNEAAISRVLNGGRVTADDVVGDGDMTQGMYGLFGETGSLLALAEFDGDRFRWSCVLEQRVPGAG